MMLNCREMTENATSYLEGRLGWGARIGIAMHVAMCRHCRRYFRQMKQTIRLLAGLPPEPMSLDLEARLLHQFRQSAAALPREQPP